MIERVRIENFRALRNVDVRLKPLTVLIGPNDTGKSSFLDWLAEGASHVNIESSASVSSARTTTLFRLAADGPEMSSVAARESPDGAPPPLAPSGDNIAAILDTLACSDPERYARISDSLRRLVPGLQRIEIHTPKTTSRAVGVVTDDARITGAELSAGVRRLLFFATLLHHPHPPALVLLEEPAHGLHTRHLGEVMGMLRALTGGAPGAAPAQVILTTHSPYLLDHVKLPEDQVLVFRREPDGSRSVSEVAVERLKLFLDEFMLGEVWFNQEEDGLVAKG